MIYLESYSEFDSPSDFVDYAIEYADEYYLGDNFFNYEDIKERLILFAKTPFPYGVYELADRLILYRLLNVDKKDDIDLSNIGLHYVGDKEMFDDEDFLFSSSILSGNDGIKKWFIIEVEVLSSDLDISNMFGNRAEYPSEFEYTLKPDVKPKIINIIEVDNSHHH